MRGEGANGGSDDRAGAPAWDQAELLALAAAIDAVADDATEPDRILTVLRKQESEAGDAPRTDTRAMVERALDIEFSESKRYFAALDMGEKHASSDLFEYPPPLDSVRPEERDCWFALWEVITHPLPKTHLADLILAVGLRSDLAAAQDVVEGYVGLARSVRLGDYYRASCLRRAWSLARQYSLGSEGVVRRALYDMAVELLDRESTPPGTAFRVLEPLALGPRTGEFDDPDRSTVIALVDAADRRWGAQPFCIESIQEVREQLAETDDARRDARRARVQRYLDLADASEGFLRATWLDKAAETAQQYGLHDMRDAAVAARQEITADGLGFQAIAAEASVHRRDLQHRWKHYRRCRSAPEALCLWLTTPAPTGNSEENIESAERIARSSLRSLTSRTTVDSHGMTITSSVGPEQASAEELDRIETLNAGWNGVTLAGDLREIGRRFEQPSGVEMGALLATIFSCDLEMAEDLGDAVEAFWQERYTDAARAAYPLVEAAARGVLLLLGVPIYRIETGESEGRFPSLETYVGKLEGEGLDPDWVRTLANPIARLRNSMAHGHKRDATAEEAALLLRAAGMLVLITPPRSSESERTELPARLRDPIAFVGRQAGFQRRWRRVWEPAFGPSPLRRLGFGS